MRAHDRAVGSIPLWTSQEIAGITGGEPVGGSGDCWFAGNVGYYPDEVGRGDLVLTTSPLAWGRKFADTAHRIPEMIRGGASAILTHAVPAEIALPADHPILRVPNTRVALDMLGEAARSRFVGRVICIHGDRGRSTTRRILAHVLGMQAATVANDRRYGGARGVALALARTPATFAYCVCELTTKRPDSTLAATRLARPHVTVVTDVRPARSKSATDVKALVFEGLEPGGIVIVNRDLPHCDRLMLAAMERGATRVVTFGRSPMSDVCLIEHSDADVSEVRASVDGHPIAYSLPSPSRSLLMSTLAVLATMHVLGADWRRAATAFTEDLPPVS